MDQQEADLLDHGEIIGRYKTLVGMLAVLGLLVGAVLAALSPAVFRSHALVVAATPACPNGSICGGPLFTQDALPSVTARTFSGLTRMTADVVSVSATGRTAVQAEAAADTAARRYIAYADSLVYAGGQPPSALLQPAATATGGTSPQKQLLADTLLGLVFGALLGVVAAQAGSRTTIDPLAPPRGVSTGGPGGGAGQEPGVPLEQLALERVSGRAAGYGPA